MTLLSVCFATYAHHTVRHVTSVSRYIPRSLFHRFTPSHTHPPPRPSRLVFNAALCSRCSRSLVFSAVFVTRRMCVRRRRHSRDRPRLFRSLEDKKSRGAARHFPLLDRDGSTYRDTLFARSLTKSRRRVPNFSVESSAIDRVPVRTERKTFCWMNAASTCVRVPRRDGDALVFHGTLPCRREL